LVSERKPEQRRHRWVHNRGLSEKLRFSRRLLKALEEQMQMPDIDKLGFEERLGLLLDREITFREDRHGLRSTLITSQLPVKHWHDIIADPTLADAILDRLVHNAYKLVLNGESMRKNNLN